MHGRGKARWRRGTKRGPFCHRFGVAEHGFFAEGPEPLYGHRPIQRGDLSVDSEGNVFVSDWQAQTLSKFSPTGRFRWSIGGSTVADPGLVVRAHLGNVDSHDRLVAANERGSIVYVDGQGHQVDGF